MGEPAGKYGDVLRQFNPTQPLRVWRGDGVTHEAANLVIWLLPGGDWQSVSDHVVSLQSRGLSFKGVGSNVS